MVVCSPVHLIPGYRFVCVTASGGLLRQKSLWQCGAGWRQAWPACQPPVSSFVLMLLFFLEALFRIHKVKLCMLGVMGTFYRPLHYSQTIQCFNFFGCNGFLSPSFPSEGASFGLGCRETTLLVLVRRWGTASVSAKLAVLEPQQLVCHTLVRRNVWSGLLHSRVGK